MTLTDYFASLIRTAVPLVVGAVIATVVKRAPGLESLLVEAEVSAWLNPLCAGLYYAGVRKAEQRWPSVGWLLGLAKQPGYSDQPPPAPAPEG